MTPVERRAQAEKMRKNAAKARDPAVRGSFLTMAADWDKLAKDAVELARRQGLAPSVK